MTESEVHVLKFVGHEGTLISPKPLPPPKKTALRPSDHFSTEPSSDDDRIRFKQLIIGIF